MNTNWFKNNTHMHIRERDDDFAQTVPRPHFLPCNNNYYCWTRRNKVLKWGEGRTELTTLKKQIGRESGIEKKAIKERVNIMH